ncbi:MAG TPA: family 16 glycoside hydrolase, partial [Candidatus Acidoferrales bacterium]|nr:family 16 glycoside hydrolase [Candidatus Acidoferrales bacterium]
MKFCKNYAGRLICSVSVIAVVSALTFLVYTPPAASQQAEQGAQAAQAGQPGRGGAPGAAAQGRGGGGGFTHAAQADYNDNTGFTSLFNGTDLSGWTSDGQNWSVKDGAIYAVSTCEKPTGTIYVYSNIGLAGDFD